VEILIFIHFKVCFIQFCLAELEGNVPAVMGLIFNRELKPYIIMKRAAGSVIFYKDKILA
jgi:hypothetical protein